jgi:hypothetical protein
LKFEKRSQFFVGGDDESLSIAAMRISQQGLFARENPQLRRSPNSNRLC